MKKLLLSSLLIINYTISAKLDDKDIQSLFNAITHGDLHKVQAISSKGFNIHYQQRGTALMQAAYYGQSDIVEYFLDLGGRKLANEKDLYGDTALIYALRSQADTKDKIKVITLLLKAKADPNISNNDGKSAVSLALGNKFEDPKIVEIFQSYQKPGYLKSLINWVANL